MLQPLAHRLFSPHAILCWAINSAAARQREQKLTCSLSDFRGTWRKLNVGSGRFPSLGSGIKRDKLPRSNRTIGIPKSTDLFTSSPNPLPSTTSAVKEYSLTSSPYLHSYHPRSSGKAASNPQTSNTLPLSPPCLPGKAPTKRLFATTNLLRAPPRRHQLPAS
ncbi:hypothetical protein IWX90DRAFT_301811 [Phyllosticta citrichinensis]|uniref:Uncharacterized protein n=1 Tax=Phyllosticta citrichinensis TaxID=1130410 RepID=A0ABR1XL68_9PEZI